MPKRFTISNLAAACVALALLAGCAAAPSGTPAPRHADVNGARLAYVEQGRGVPVVLVHGAMSDYRIWDRQRVALAANGYRAISYTQRYFGSEPWRHDGPKFGVPVQANDLAAFIRALGAGPVHLVAWSMSGHTALTVALEHPELVSSAFVYEPAVPSYVSDPADLKALGDDRAPLAGAAVQAAKAGDNAAAARLLLDGVDDRKGVFEGLRPEMQTIVMDNARTIPLMFGAEAPPPISCAQLGRLGPRVAIARGELTRPFYRIIADAAAKCVAGGRLIVAANGRHMWPEVDAAAFNATVLEHLKGR